MQSNRSAMDIILVDAPQAVQRTVLALGIYLVLIVPVDTLVVFGGDLLGKPPANPPFFSKFVAYEIIGRLLVVIVTSAAQAIVFSRMAREIDKPLWRSLGDMEALRHYFPLWAGLNLAIFSLFTLASLVSSSSESPAQVLFMLGFLMATITTPIGAAVMFRGKVTLESFQEAFMVFPRQLTKSLAILLVSFWMVFLCFYLGDITSQQKALYPFIDVISVYFDCILCAATFHVCRIDRENPEDTTFDF